MSDPANECPIGATLIEDFAARKLTPEAEREFLSHQKECPECQKATIFEKSLRDTLARLWPQRNPRSPFSLSHTPPTLGGQFLRWVLAIACGGAILGVVWFSMQAANRGTPRRMEPFSTLTLVNGGEVHAKILADHIGEQFRVTGGFPCEILFSSFMLVRIHSGSTFFLRENGLLLVKGILELAMSRSGTNFLLETNSGIRFDLTGAKGRIALAPTGEGEFELLQGGGSLTRANGSIYPLPGPCRLNLSATGETTTLSTGNPTLFPKIVDGIAFPWIGGKLREGMVGTWPRSIKSFSPSSDKQKK